jgi:PncC family amidohydrolase
MGRIGSGKMKNNLESMIGEELKRRGYSLATAESCTAGLVAHRITNVAGSSDYFLGGIVAYSNKVKENLLGVSAETLDLHGAVSEEVARQMAEGACRLFGANIGLSVTGIAGPGGGTDDKPVGLTYIAVSAPKGTQVQRLVWDGEREANKAQSATAVLRMLCYVLEELP